ncbi:hypothetical protein [uncultured Methanobrevibacter sp.]|uniref:hypothetical protein n=1 Tax=uncultured Methanobrevibacter sp. TaxID=253161 RepID=UPI002619CEBC|nr:hypothetical protein [uncultured Methanobrevibacter sp.]
MENIINLSEENNVKTELINNKLYVYLNIEYFRSKINDDGEDVMELVDSDTINFETDDYEICFTPCSRGLASHVFVDNEIKVNPHQVNLSSFDDVI